MKESTSALYTIGYQGKTIDSFVEELQAAGIAVLLDVRRIPTSRKAGFSKHKLAARLAEAGIEYHHYVDLGMPRDLMKHRSTTDNTPILTAYRDYLPTVASLVDEIVEQAQTHRACLFCFEADHTLCHRTVLADLVHERTGLPMVHL